MVVTQAVASGEIDLRKNTRTQALRAAGYGDAPSSSVREVASTVFHWAIDGLDGYHAVRWVNGRVLAWLPGSMLASDFPVTGARDFAVATQSWDGKAWETGTVDAAVVPGLGSGVLEVRDRTPLRLVAGALYGDGASQKMARKRRGEPSLSESVAALRAVGSALEARLGF